MAVRIRHDMEKQMRIAYIYDAVYPWVKGGAEKRIYELSSRLAGRGHEVHWYGIRWWGEEPVLIRNGVHLHGICPPMALYKDGRRSIHEAICFAESVLLRLRESYDIIDCQEFPYLPCFSAKIRSIFGSGELIITWLEVWRDYWSSYLGFPGHAGALIERLTSKIASRNIAISNRTKSDLLGLGLSDVEVVPGGIDFPRISNVIRSEKISDIVYAGRLIDHKNIDMLIRAMVLVKRDVPDIKALIIGEGPQRASIIDLARASGLERNVDFMGFLEYDEMISLIKSSRVFVLPSTREGFGIAALEANACGLPVVTVRHPRNAACDLISEGTGFVCDIDPNSIASAVLESLEKRNDMRPQCIENAKRYDWDCICDTLEGIYKRSGL